MACRRLPARQANRRCVCSAVALGWLGWCGGAGSRAVCARKGPGGLARQRQCERSVDDTGIDRTAGRPLTSGPPDVAWPQGKVTWMKNVIDDELHQPMIIPTRYASTLSQLYRGGKPAGGQGAG